MLLAREYRRPFWAHHLATRASRGVSLVAMGADPHDLPSGFSVVSDSIRRDREALFGATRLDVPTIADGDDSSDGSDVEAPVFFTTTGSDAEAEAEGEVEADLSMPALQARTFERVRVRARAR